MGRIVTQAKITNTSEPARSIHCDLLVDTGAGALLLPSSWKERLGQFENEEKVELLLANGESIDGTVCAPARIELEGFRPVYNEVVFTEMKKEPDKEYEPLLGYVVLEQAQAAVDMLGHRLVPVKYIDMK